MNLGIRNKLAVVTGASRNIGQGIAAELAREGARVILVARHEKELKAVQRALPGGARRHAYVAADLMSAENAAKLAQTILKKIGAPEIVVHNLGGSLGVQDPLAPAAEWEKVWHFNLGAAVELNHALIPPMIKRKWGRVLHLSTLSTTTYRGYAAYVSAKAAVDAYVKVVGRAVAKDNVILSAVAPGAIYTEGRYFAKTLKENPSAMDVYYREHLPVGRLGTTAEIGGVAAFLCSEHAGFMTGSIVGLDGGGM